MDISSTLQLSADEKKELARIFSCAEADLPTVLAQHSNAALEELVSMYLGQKVFTRGSDILEYRLQLLIKHAFGGKIPDEQDVCKLFQMTSSGSRSLIRAVMSKYQYQLKSEIEATMKALVSQAAIGQEDDEITISVHNLNLVEELNRELAEIDTNLPPVQKKRGSVSTFAIPPSSYSRLCKRFGLEEKEKKDQKK